MDVLKKLQSKDGSKKYLFKLKDNQVVEALAMIDRNYELTYHSTVCVSSQVGCKLGCAFCATGKQGFVRNLSAAEIVGQVSICNQDNKDAGIIPVDAVVFAGMGEPLYNYANVKLSILKLYSEFGINNFEVATVGIVPRINQMIEDFKQIPVHIRLNLSLHASTDELRVKLMPISSKFNVNTILNAAVKYSIETKSRARIRYSLFKGLNDGDEDIERLVTLLENKPLKLIVSQYNDNEIPELVAPSIGEVQKFHEKISKRIDAGVFYNFGSDVQGGCGQLRRINSL